MLPLEVVFEVPSEIVRGLATGALERVGGVIRETGSKQVVAWLREGGNIAENPNLADGFLRPLLNVSSGGMASAGFGALDLVVSSHRHNQVMQQFNALTNLVNIVGGIGVLNLAATVVSTAILLRRLGQIEENIEGLFKDISKEFCEDRRVKMQDAIQAAGDALNMDDPANRKLQANAAIRELFQARQHIWREIDNAKGSPNSSENNKLMQHNLFQAMQLDELRCRCQLELGEYSRATDYLSDKLNAYLETSRHLVHRHLGDHRAIFFHKSIRESELLRYVGVENWLRQEGNRLLEVVLANRHDFWNRDIADEKKIRKPGKESHTDALTESELLIENCQRLHGFHAEIEAIQRLGISHAEWQRAQDEALAKAEIDLAEHDDYVFLVNKEQLELLDRQTT